MEKIIDPVDVELLLKELTPDKKLRNTNKNNNEIYVVTYHDSPNVLREIGRLREITFRDSNGGVGKSCDIDYFDTMEKPYRQLIVWDPESMKIIGGYRFICGPDICLDEHGQPVLATAPFMHFSQNFIDNYLVHVMELGRAFIAPEFQSTKAGRKALFALDNLWDGLGALMVERPGLKYFFGKVTIYPWYNALCRDMIFYFMDLYFHDDDRLVTVSEPMHYKTDVRELEKLFTGDDFKADYARLNKEVRANGENIPPLVNSYIKLSQSMRYFGNGVCEEFGNAIEAGILIDFDQMYDDKKERHVDSFIKDKETEIKHRFPLFAKNAGESLFSQLQERRALRQERRKRLLEKRSDKDTFKYIMGNFKIH